MQSKLTKVIFLLTAVLSLAGSSVAACACSHHAQPVEAEKLSCHTKTHGTVAETQPEQPVGNALSQGCECFVRTAAPAIASKGETKYTKQVKAPIETTASDFGLDAIASVDEVQAASSNVISIHYSGLNLRSGPSRAPPRL